MPVNPIPDGYPRVMAYLYVDGAADAIAFYTSVFGAKERMRLPAPEGKVGHAELEIGDSLVMLADESPDMGARSPKHFGGSPMSMMVYVDDVDAAFAEALSLGAKQDRPVEQKFYGDRSGSFVDPWGHTWAVASHTEDVAPEEMERRMQAFTEDA